MELLYDQVIGARRVVVAATDRRDGDIHPRHVPPPVLAARQHAVAGAPWLMVDQVHGTGVVHVDARSARWPLAGVGDVIVAPSSDRPTAVWAADCAAVALMGADGAIVMFHAGWRGLAAGIVDVALAAVASADDRTVAAVVGPVIHPCCYPFGADDLATVAAGAHTTVEEVTGRTADGQDALDVPAVVRVALGRHGVAVDVVGPCTGCGPLWFSHRVRGDAGRHALVTWGADETADVAR